MLGLHLIKNILGGAKGKDSLLGVGKILGGVTDKSNINAQKSLLTAVHTSEDISSATKREIAAGTLTSSAPANILAQQAIFDEARAGVAGEKGKFSQRKATELLFKTIADQPGRSQFAGFSQRARNSSILGV